MSRRRRSRRQAARGALGGLRKNIKRVGGGVVGIVGLSIALAPAIQGVNAATGGGTYINTDTMSKILPAIQANYGVSGNSVDLGKLITQVAFPVVGGLLFVKGVRMMLKAV